jgi:uncharacterized glyoxalase superfamily protein PhnB
MGQVLGAHFAVKTPRPAQFRRFLEGIIQLQIVHEGTSSLRSDTVPAVIEVFDAGKIEDLDDWGHSPFMPGVQVNDLDTAMERLASQGVPLERDKTVRQWGAFCYVRDPDGNVWHLWEATGRIDSVAR